MCRSLCVIGFLGMLSAAAFSFAEETAAPTQQPQQPVYTPWLTGPLIIPAGTVTPKGHYDIDAYLYVTTITGNYDSRWRTRPFEHNFYSINPLVIAIIGITEWMDFQVTPEILYNISQNQSSVHFGDLPAGFDFQLYPADPNSWIPGLKLTLKETFPTGKYQKLNPRKKGTDLSGEGSFATNASVQFYQLYHLHKHHFLSATLNLSYTYSAPVRVRGFNAYGGGFGTRGRVRPGDEFEVIASFEYTLNQNWVLAIDNVYIHMNRNRFSGKAGITATGEPATVGDPSSEQISFAPAIEYNFNSSIGLIAGAWVTAWGRNSLVFRSGVLGFTYAY